MPSVGEMIPHLQPWETFDWSLEQKQAIYLDWGLFYARRRREKNAIRNLNNSLQLKHDDPKALYYRSKCKRNIADPFGALQDTLRAVEIVSEPNAPLNLEICDALYDLNQFESSIVQLNNSKRNFSGKKISSFEIRMDVLGENFEDTLGESLSPFIYENEKHFNQVLEIVKSRNAVDVRPLWKILKAQGKCDVLSVLEKEVEVLSPIEIARRQRVFEVFTQNYMNRSWIDILFLKGLRKNWNLLLPQCMVSTPYLRYLADSKYDVIKRFLKMLQARSPMYNVRYQKFPNKDLRKKQQNDHLHRIQYQTRRNMMTVLRTVRELRKAGKVEKLSNYVEEVMGDYVVLKTHCIMPWKLEFLNEVYNTFALTVADQFTVPSDIMQYRSTDRLARVLRISTDKNKERPGAFVFGDKSTYSEPNAIDPAFLKYTQYIARLEKRMIFAKYSIEKCYLYHEMARSHLKQSRFDECCWIARKAVDESRRCHSYLWGFLSTMLMLKAHAYLHKVERIKEVIHKASKMSYRLKSVQLCTFVDVCRTINAVELSMKKPSNEPRIRSGHSMRSVDRSSKRSFTALNSIIDGDSQSKLHSSAV